MAKATKQIKKAGKSPKWEAPAWPRVADTEHKARERKRVLRPMGTRKG